MFAVCFSIECNRASKHRRNETTHKHPLRLFQLVFEIEFYGVEALKQYPSPLATDGMCQRRLWRRLSQQKHTRTRKEDFVFIFLSSALTNHAAKWK